MTHGDEREGKWRGNWRMEWIVSTLRTTSEHGVLALLPLMRTPRLPAVDWTDAPLNLNGLVRFAERRNLVSARVPSHFNWPVPRSKHFLPQLHKTSRLMVYNVKVDVCFEARTEHI